ncbi:(d)CMP kinase [Clostridium formicaceticum]|uniref:Cytidylate kinase n=1 Tax=Clostridium formicaceticum TaxID=1497 RepID=A0AAC9RKL2_9CLOT|nr:(d)CMP kinase [Clostridium formicaceticum]AOY77243.1 cytidylate kinase [Clostridium formicaceticum]ARE87776.1 Cytidylate kinase [Clostridium formicaceticum]
MGNLQIAIDGPAGAGKSTIAKKLAEGLNITYIDTGAMYRALTYKVLKENIEINCKEKIIQLAETTNITIVHGDVYIDNQLVKDEIRSQEVTKYVSHIAQIAEVRKILVGFQKKIAEQHSVVMDGRDIGTYVLPNADIKIFLTASIEERAHRRYTELLHKQQQVSFADVIDSIKERDKIDTEREFAPLVKAADAVVVDTTGLDIEAVVEKIQQIIAKKLQN